MFCRENMEIKHILAATNKFNATKIENKENK